MATKRTEKEKVQLWQDRLSMGQKKLDQVKPEWEEFLKNYRNQYWADDGVMQHRVSVGVVTAIVSLMVPSIYFKDPHVRVQARRPGDERACRLTETLLNYYISELKLKRQVKRCIVDAALFGLAYMRLGYEVLTELSLRPVMSQTDQGQPMGNEAGEQFFEDDKGNIYVERDGKFIQLMDGQGNTVPTSPEMPTLNEFIRREQPFAVRWSPFDVIKDPEGKYADLSDASWVAFKMAVPLAEIKSNPLYSNTKDLAATHTIAKDLLRERSSVSASGKEPDEEFERVELYEIWCKQWNAHKQRYEMYQKVVAKDHDKFLLDRPSPYLAEGFPIAVLSFQEDPEDGYPLPPLAAINSQIETINDSRAQQANHRTRFNRRYIANENVVPKEAAERVARAVDGEIVMVNVPPEFDLRKAFVAVEDAPLGQEIYNDYNLAFDEIQKVMGITDYNMGGGGPARKATEANFIQSSSSVRLVEKQDLVGDFVLDVARFWKQLLQQFGDYTTALKITNDVGQEEWVSFKIAEAIPEDLSWAVDVSPSAFESKELEQKRWADLYNLTANDPMVNKSFILERLFRAYGIQEPQAAMVPPQMMPSLGPDGQPIESVAQAGGAVDVNQFREPAATDVGATGRAASG